MEQSFNNIALFIKRAEEYHTKEFIIDAFASKKIGKIRDVTFIKKQNDSGNSYNGVIVIFERWNNNKLVEKLLQEMSESSDGTTKFYFNPYRFWHIKVHQQYIPNAEEKTVVDSALPDKERIEQLEALVKSMTTNMFQLQTRLEKTERIMMDNELKDAQHHLYNMELKSQLEQKDMEMNWAEEEYNEELDALHQENETLKESLRCKQILNSIELAKKEYECEKLKQELRENSCILNYVENQTKELLEIVKIVSKDSPMKPYVDAYVKDNFQ
jgi:hypothetical protein